MQFDSPSNDPSTGPLSAQSCRQSGGQPDEQPSCYQFHYQMDDEAYRRMLADVQLVFTRQASSQRLVRGYIAFSGIAIATLATLAFSIDVDVSNTPEFSLSVLLLMVALAFSWYMNRLFVGSYTQAVLDENQHWLGQDTALLLSSSGLSLRTVNSHSTVGWGGVSHIYAANDYLLFMCEYFSVALPYSVLGDAIDARCADIEALSGQSIITIATTR